MAFWLSISHRNHILINTSLPSSSVLVIKFYMQSNMESWVFFCIERLSKRPRSLQVSALLLSAPSHSGSPMKSINGLFLSDKRTSGTLPPTQLVPPSWFWVGYWLPKNGDYARSSAINGWTEPQRCRPNPVFSPVKSILTSWEGF